jgi:hypothetical protein
MEYVVIWLIFGFLSGIIASNKNLSFGSYFVVGVLLGPIGLVIALVSKPSTPEPTTDAAVWVCPYCAEQVMALAKVCKHCGRDIHPVHPT